MSRDSLVRNSEHYVTVFLGLKELTILQANMFVQIDGYCNIRKNISVKTLSHNVRYQTNNIQQFIFNQLLQILLH